MQDAISQGQCWVLAEQEDTIAAPQCQQQCLGGGQGPASPPRVMQPMPGQRGRDPWEEAALTGLAPAASLGATDTPEMLGTDLSSQWGLCRYIPLVSTAGPILGRSERWRESSDCWWWGASTGAEIGAKPAQLEDMKHYSGDMDEKRRGEVWVPVCLSWWTTEIINKAFQLLK